MRALVQRVKRGRVTVDGREVGAVGRGYVVLLGVSRDDTPTEAEWLAQKVANIRLFEDEQGKLNLSLLDTGGEVLVISQFTLYGDARKGRRPSFVRAAPSGAAEPLIQYFAQSLAGHGVGVAQGQFGAEMLVEIHNDGPVTLFLEKEPQLDPA